MLALRQHGVSFKYAKSSRSAKTPDFVLQTPRGTVVLEVGGKGKGRTRFKDLAYDRKVVAYHGTSRRRLPQSPLYPTGRV